MILLMQSTAAGVQSVFWMNGILWVTLFTVFFAAVLIGRKHHREMKVWMEKIKKHEEQLRVLENMRAELISEINHDLRNPLTSLQGSLAILDGGLAGPLSKEGKKMAKIAANNCERLSELVNELIELENESTAPLLEEEKMMLLKNFSERHQKTLAKQAAASQQS